MSYCLWTPEAPLVSEHVLSQSQTPIVYTRRKWATLQDFECQPPERDLTSLNPTGENITFMAPLIDDAALLLLSGKVLEAVPVIQYKIMWHGKLLPSYHTFVTQLDNIQISNIVQDALKSPKRKKVVDEEIKALESNGMWTLTMPPLGKSPTGYKWIFTVKYKSNGSVERFKARLVVKGFT